MNNGRTQIKHEVLNLLTAINMILGMPRIDQCNKKKVQDFVKVIGLLISHEGLITGEKVQFVNEEFNLSDIIDLVLCINRDCLKKNKVLWGLPEHDWWIYADKMAVKDFLAELITHLAKIATSIEFSFHDAKRTLQVNYKGTGTFFIKKRSLLTCLKDKKCIVLELPIRIFIELLNRNGIKLKFGKKVIKIIFPA